MRRIIFILSALMLFGGVASADREWRRHRDASGGTVIRDSRHRDFNDARPRYRDYSRRDYRNYSRVRVERRPVYVNNGRFQFHGGYHRTYHRPVIKYRYYDYRVRPQIIVENYDPVPGYIWVQGQWTWTGYEWTWQSGYYAPDPSWTQPYYDDSYYGTYGNTSYDDPYDGSSYDSTYYPSSHTHDAYCSHH